MSPAESESARFAALLAVIPRTASEIGLTDGGFTEEDVAAIAIAAAAADTTAQITALIGAAPATLNTLTELADALNDDASFAATMTSALTGKSATGHGHAIADTTGLQAALDGKQASGTYASGSGSASGTNTGDNAVNTLYSGLVSNATHTGDATGATALTLATVNSNVGSFTSANITVNAKGLITAASNGSGGGSLTLTTVEKDLGSVARTSGTFDITGLSGLTAGRPVLIQQASGPYTGKGDLADECEETVAVCASVLDATTIRAFWNSGRAFVVGNFKFNYLPA